MIIGFLWGFIPCGLVYSTLPLAFLSGSALSGAGLMVAMGLGTLPNLLLISGLVGKIAGSVAQVGHASYARWIVAGLMATAGLMGLYRALTLTDDFLKGGFCFS
jgi:sulfite exporter TauE/SafE